MNNESYEELIVTTLQDIIRNGDFTVGLEQKLMNTDYTKESFAISDCPVLLIESQLEASGLSRADFYEKTIKIWGCNYLVCNKWAQQQAELFKHWYDTKKYKKPID